MTAFNRQDASDVERRIAGIFSAQSTGARVREIRRLFVETLDFRRDEWRDFPIVYARAGRRGIARRRPRLVASLDGVHVVYVDMAEADASAKRVRRGEAAGRRRG